MSDGLGILLTMLAVVLPLGLAWYLLGHGLAARSKRRAPNRSKNRPTPTRPRPPC